MFAVVLRSGNLRVPWIPAFAGMTNDELGQTIGGTA